MIATGIITKDFKKFENLFLKLKNGLRFSRLGKPFTTTNNKYFFDTGTGKVFKLNDNVYSVLDCLYSTDKFEELFELDMSLDDLKSALTEIEEAVSTENILQNPPIMDMLLNNGNKNEKDITQTQVRHLTIEMTERCNLRCKYCIYHDDSCGFRTFGKKNITFDTIKKAIDMLSESTEEEVFVSFYGGEPLLEFDLIKKTIEYCDNKMSHKKVGYNMTTNATLITEEIANYLASLEEYFTTISLDGPKLIHNKNRVFRDGTGSFDNTIEGIKNLVKAEGEKANKRINFNVVLDDTSTETLEEIQDFFRTSEFIPEGSQVTASYIDIAPKDFKYLGVGTKEDRQYNDFIRGKRDPLTAWSVDKLKSKTATLNSTPLISRDFIDKGLARIHKRMFIDKPAQVHYMNGCCVPGGRRLYLTVNGDFAVCERLGPSPFLGNVDEGIDFKKIKKYYITDFVNEAKKYCNDCWAINTCSLCYTNCYDKEGLQIGHRHLQCA
ncbi:radical SAM protein [Clostridioides difficile]|nr:radical SAM protein [Clostridioides difficile]